MPPPTPAAKKDTERSIPVPPLGKLTYLASHEHQVLPQLTEAAKQFSKVTDMDGQLRERFQEVDTFSKTIPPLEAVKAEFAKTKDGVKNEAQSLQDIEVIVKTIRSLLSQIGNAAAAAHKNLLITEDDLKAANDLQRAKELRSRLDLGPLGKLIMSANKAAGAWAKAEADPIGAVGAALDLTENLLSAMGLDTLNQQIHSLEEEAGKLTWKSAIAKFKLAEQNLKDLQDAHANLVEPFKKAKDQYAFRKKDLPQAFDADNKKKKGKFYFQSMTDLSDRLKKYREFAQQAVTGAYHATESIHKMQGALGTDWMANASQDKDILEKMVTVSKRATERAIHERDGADAHIKIVQKQIDELEVLLSKTGL
jgi:hypothetical protein